jgi:hypothetical protein
MTTPNPLSPAAQKVWAAFHPTGYSRMALANALRAAAAQIAAEEVPPEEHLLAIATELEGPHG